jgi:hypothetical protein
VTRSARIGGRIVDRHPALERLSPLIGEWSMQTSLGPAVGRASFEWVLGGQYLLERTGVPGAPGAPDGLAIIEVQPEGSYLQHYYDSRGVTRLYSMTFEHGTWTLLRDKPDLTPLDFAQRYVGQLSPDGDTIDGRWEISDDGAGWRVDFTLTFSRLA